jgi:eukaryotic-like serine/threonine-protein kinase
MSSDVTTSQGFGPSLSALEPGTPMLGKYVIERLLGQGGSSTVYAARHLLLDRVVALKVLRNLPDGGAGRARLLLEARLLANLLHRNVVKIYEHGLVNDDTAFLALELLEGETLLARAVRGVVPVGEMLPIAAQILDALEEVHGQRVTHRDVTLGNVFLERDRVVLLDFGIGRTPDETRITDNAAPIGTPGYFAPEQLNSDIAVDARTDLYQLGVLIYRCINGRLPFEGAGGALFARILFERPDPPSTLRAGISASLDELLARALEKAPRNRFQTAAEMRDALSRCR